MTWITVRVEPSSEWLDAAVLAVVRAAGARVSDDGYVSFPSVIHSEAARNALAAMIANGLTAAGPHD